MEPFFSRLPSVARPEKQVLFKNKVMWTIAILALYFVLSNVPLFGMSAESIDLFAQYRAFFAGATGSLIVLGIGPIVTASIILQLLVGGDIIHLDLSDPKDQAYFQGAQKFLVFVMIVLETLPQLFGYIKPDPALAATLGVDLWVVTAFLFIQICIGGILIMFMDEVVSKWGIGSGISLFIVAGVSQQIVTGLINWLPGSDGLAIGIIPKWFQLITSGELGALFSSSTGIMYLLINAGILALISTIAIFIIVVYVESVRIEIPLAHTSVRGARGKFPVKLIYASVLPMILVRALQANIQLVGVLLAGRGITILGEYSGATPVNGIMYYLSAINSPSDWIPTYVQQHFATLGYPAPATWQIGLHVGVDAFLLIAGGIIFALFWIETTGMGAKQTAKKIYNSGMQVPGFRNSIASIEKYMQRYIPKVTVIGGAFIGALTLFASLLGTVGGAGGTGLLLTVSIVYRLYEDLASEQMMEMHPMLRSFLGKDD
ncbi:Protein translocase subunit SecY [Methanolapillus ohkumae]|uniref:Protein translocase subunit SecY n=1 Tax=Methanolapillus ohkumae TaxID=3028298 RepID=A0AA96V5S1_9EURY|nr:Protein translocase subunit SecY [Methanosarcinaceae archaeon Am2]